MKKEKISIFWFRRDLRLIDNHGLFKALTGPYPVLPIFIFDTNILDGLAKDDPRVSFIYDQLLNLNEKFKDYSCGLKVIKGAPINAFKNLINDYDVQAVFFNEDYEPYAQQRDHEIQSFLADLAITTKASKDHVIHAKNEVLKADKSPYTVYTPYKNKWMEKLNNTSFQPFKSENQKNYYKCNPELPSLEEIGFKHSTIKVLEYDLKNLDSYEDVRNFPSLNQTSQLSPHLRFGTVSLRLIVSKVLNHQSFLNELIWREFFIQILYHFPDVVHSNFKKKYNNIMWRNNKEEFKKWKSGTTGFPIVDAGMRELNATGYMHNRVRMIVASFLCKHLLIDWKWGEAYFAEKLIDYELASNNGNWQWSAGTGSDSAPYFRVFNPTEQTKKFDKDLSYIKKWVPELETLNYSLPIVDHKFARERALRVYKQGLNNL